jgi:hypothetical protein
MIVCVLVCVFACVCLCVCVYKCVCVSAYMLMYKLSLVNINQYLRHLYQQVCTALAKFKA